MPNRSYSLYNSNNPAGNDSPASQAVLHFEHIDLLRVFAILGVLFQHSSTYFSMAVGDTFCTQFCWRASRWCFLLFIFISGFLLIPKQISISIMWERYIKRILVVFLVWSVLYSCYNTIVLIGSTSDCSFFDLVKRFIGDVVSGGTDRLWYLVMLVGLYAIIPAISVLYNINRVYIYVLLLLFIVSIFLPTLCCISPFETLLGTDIGRIMMVYPGYVVFYCLLGGGIRMINRDILLKYKWFFYFFLIIAIPLIGVMVNHGNMPEMSFAGYFFIVMGLVIFSYDSFSKWPAIIKGVVKNIAECSFGIYLIHTFIQYALLSLNVCNHLASFAPIWIAIPIYCLGLFIICWLCTWLIRRTPIGRRIT